MVDGRQHLAIANRHQGLQQILERTHWAGRSGTRPVWVQAARRLALRHGGVERSTRTLWFAGTASRATLIPLEAVLAEADVAAAGENMT
jgi:hypothetical protein